MRTLEGPQYHRGQRVPFAIDEEMRAELIKGMAETAGSLGFALGALSPDHPAYATIKRAIADIDAWRDIIKD